MGHGAKKAGKRSVKSAPDVAQKRRDADRRLRQHVRFARILKLLEILQGRRRQNAASLAQEMEVSVRTVRRDLEVLGLAGVRVEYDRVEQSYVLHGDYRFAVTGLTDEELLGQATAATLTSAKGLDVGAGAGPTVRKLGATVKDGARKLLEDAQRVTAVLDLGLADHDGHREVIRTIQFALVQKCALEGIYASPHRPGENTVLLHPIRLCLLKQAWYLIARPDGTDHPVTYRVARFRSLRRLDLRSDVPDEFDLRAYFGDAWAVFRGKPSYDVELRFLPPAAPLVQETTWHHTQRIRQGADGSVTLEFRVDGLEEIVWWVLGWSGTVEVVRPAELREMVAEKLRHALALNAS